jgi:DNA-binding LacI/PurR family transcriptional regulator
MRLVVDYLVAAGHTAVAHLGGLGGVVAEERVAGYRAAMTHHGLESEIVVAESDFTEDAGYRGAARLLRGGRPVTAIAAVNDLAAVGAMSAVADAGLRVPGDVAVTGYDDTFVAAIRQVSADLGQPGQPRHRNSGGALRAPPDRGSRAARGGASAAAAAW